MLLSMTGYGRSEQLMGDKTFLVEIKSLNGKQYDIRLNLPSLLKPFEFKIRNLISDQLIRGSIECTVTIKQNGAGKSVALNADLAKHFYIAVERLARELNASTENLLGSILKLPEVISSSTEVLTEEQYSYFEKVLQEALTAIEKHREGEGAALEEDLLLRIANIEKYQPLIAEKEGNRRVRIKEHLTKILEDHVGKEAYDAHRLEQELVYYIEKIDISEEQVRLKTHCAYFKEIMQEETKSKGKKLGFVLQEIGREINTTGSKAYDLDIQRYVVQMKDELEKAKEQILNVL